MRKYIIGVSGGPDSMSLLDSYKKRIVAVCHVNYHDREDTDNDQRIVELYCKKYNLPLYIFDTKKDDISKYQDNNPQTFYRKIRYDFFLEVAKKLNNFNCLIGHNKDDFIESSYMILEKNKVNSYIGIRKKSYYNELKIIRPFISQWKKDLQEYCVKNNIDFAIDYSNFSDIYHRNEIRKIFSDYTIKQKEDYYKTIKKINRKNYFRRKRIDFIFNKWAKSNFEISFFKNINPSYKANILFLFLSKNNVKINSNKIENLIEFIDKNKNKNKEFRLSNNKFATNEKNYLKIKVKNE